MICKACGKDKPLKDFMERCRSCKDCHKAVGKDNYQRYRKTPEAIAKRRAYEGTREFKDRRNAKNRRRRVEMDDLCLGPDEY